MRCDKFFLSSLVSFCTAFKCQGILKVKGAGIVFFVRVFYFQMEGNEAYQDVRKF